MSEPLVELAELAWTPRPRGAVGGKAYFLAKLWAAGLPVPPALVIETSARDLDEAGERALFSRLRQATAGLGALLAVRSSAVLEDDVAASAPGVFASVLHVSPDDLEEAVRRVWRSADAPLVREYARARGVDDLAIAVIVQSQVPMTSGPATRAGTLYTRVPGQPGSDEMLLEVRVRGDRDVAASPIAVRLARAPSAPPESAGARPSPGPLAPAALDALVRAGLEAERVLAAAAGADVEWVAHEDTLWIVQARPIVHPSAHTEERPGLPPVLLAFSRLEPTTVWRWDVNHNPDPLTPAQSGLVERMEEAHAAPYRMRVVGGYLYTAGIEPRADVAETDAPLDAGALRARFDQELEPAMAAALAPVERAPADLERAIRAYQQVYAVYTQELSPALGRAKRALPAFLRARLGADADALAFRIAIPDELVGLDGALEEAARLQISRAQLMERIGALTTAWDVACPTLAERPELVERALPQAHERAAAHAHARDDAYALLARLRGALSPEDGDELERCAALARVARAIAERDDLLFARAQAVVRRALLELARTWRLEPTDLIFYVPLEDVLASCAHGHPPDAARVQRMARAGRASLERQLAWTPPLAFANGVPIAHQPTSAHPGESWAGQGQGGRVRGVARRVAQLTEAPSDVSGAVVVTSTVTPAMAVWMRGAAALVAEHGGLLDHGAAMARELGIPCVVACAGAWSEIRTGDVLWVDGDAGLVVRSTHPA